MKLHRLVLTNYRGITHRQVDFPDHGVVVISGANEVGKTSMIEALDLLLESKDRSTKKDVKQVKPTHADVGAEVTAEITTGPYRFVYRKRFHKKCETELTILAPRREQLSGDEAHERVRAMLDSTIDTELWRAQRVMQTATTAAVDLSGCDALSRALDVAAGQAAELSGSEPLLVDRIDQEYGRYFTATGRPTGEWGTVQGRLRDAEQAVARAAAAVAEIDDHVRRHATLTQQLGELNRLRAEAAQRRDAAFVAAEAVAELNGELQQAKSVALAMQAASVASTTALTERRRLRADVEARVAVIAAVEAQLVTAVDDEAIAREVSDEAAAAAEASHAALEEARAWADTAAWAVRQLTDRDESDRLSAKLGRISIAQRDLDRTVAQLKQIALTDASMRQIEAAVAAVERARDLVEITAARLDLVAAVDIEVLIDGLPVALSAGQTFSTAATGVTELDLPGVLSATVSAGAPAAENQAALVAAQRALAVALATARVADLEQAHQVHQRRRELSDERQRLSTTLTALSQDESVERMQARLNELHDQQPAAVGLWDHATDSATARTDLDAANVNLKRVMAESETQRKVATAAAARLTERTTAATVLREKLAGQRTEWETGRVRLAEQRAQVSDDDLVVRAEADRDACVTAVAAVQQFTARLAEVGAETVAAEWESARLAVASVTRRHNDTEVALREVAGALSVFGTEGRKGKLDVAQTEREHAAAEFVRVSRRARAAQMLRTVMARHREESRQRYVDPFRAEIERLARPVFGPSFEVDVDSSLRIQSRTLSGRTVPYDSLSGGAKEQLGILARLAGAALVAKEDTVPVVIDDALGLTDPDRLARMGSVFSAVGGDGQVIVLTCTAARYDSVEGAHRIEITA